LAAVAATAGEFATVVDGKYAASLKKHAALFFGITLVNVTDFQNSFTVGFCNEFAA